MLDDLGVSIIKALIGALAQDQRRREANLRIVGRLDIRLETVDKFSVGRNGVQPIAQERGHFPEVGNPVTDFIQPFVNPGLVIGIGAVAGFQHILFQL